VTPETLYSFGGSSTDAIGPSGVLVQATDGNFYGTSAGGINGSGNGNTVYLGYGTVYKITPAGEETVLYAFAGPPDGAYPVSLIQGSDGNFYGTTAQGGLDNVGTAFRLTPQGVETILYSFLPQSVVAYPAGLIQGSDGNFYGTAGGGVSGCGVVFKLTSEGVYTVLYSFAGSEGATDGDGARPSGQLVQGSDGNFYGVTNGGGLIIGNSGQSGPQYGGTVFKVTPEGVETILHRFSGGPDGGGPSAGLIQGRDGTFYGLASYTVFSITAEGVETALYSFPESVVSSFSDSALTQGTDGNFYGTTTGGGNNDGGTMFQLTPSGVATVLYSFPNTYAEYEGAPGATPSTNLVQGTDGNFYGAAYRDGTYDRGYFFKLVLSSH
jgi:uncharacterized repeat protein (TIGR03803 family)